ncbi:S-adenosyl-L-methionine-dependent methyltransferase [Fomes fomentarius]|nr:S-adenosyl-L-methionine-dependent methyltransferase [Fomes fomentarius]
MGDAKEGNYVFRQAEGVREEIERLDALHKGVTEFFQGGLSLADWGGFSPTSILEIGSGSGAWAIDAATRYPLARVVAIDLSPLPDRPLPPNLEFQRVNISEGYPFEDESFDVVHARLVMLHVNNGAEALRRAIKLVKPGGYIIVEDPNDYNMADNGGPLPPGLQAFHTGWFKIFLSRGADPGFGGKHEEILKSSGVFEEINVRMVKIPVSGKSDDPTLRNLGMTWNATMVRIGQDLPQRWAEYGITEEAAKLYLDELRDPSRNITIDFYFSYARKKRA